MKNILITGGAGFIGSYLCEALFNKGYSVTILDNLSPQIHAKWEGSFLYHKINGKCKFIKGDVTTREDWMEALKSADAVVHLAAETGTGQSMYEVERYYKVNVQGTALLFDVLVNQPHHVKKIIIASSRAIYGEGKYRNGNGEFVYPEARHAEDMKQGKFELQDGASGKPLAMAPTDETSKLHPSSIYGLTKLAQEQMVMLMGKQLHIPSVALRFQNVYGPGQSLSNPYTGLLAVFSNRIRNGNPLDIYEDGMESRDFVYISDIVDSIIMSLENNKADHQVFNVGSGVATPIIRVAELMRKYFGSDVEVNVSGRFRVGDIRHNCADISLIKNAIGFSPKISFEQGLESFVNWVGQQEMIEDKYEQSVKEIKERGLMN
jgi:dTDP-L-rhamnose 4-epimerase